MKIRATQNTELRRSSSTRSAFVLSACVHVWALLVLLPRLPAALGLAGGSSYTGSSGSSTIDISWLEDEGPGKEEAGLGEGNRAAAELPPAPAAAPEISLPAAAAAAAAAAPAPAPPDDPNPPWAMTASEYARLQNEPAPVTQPSAAEAEAKTEGEMPVEEKPKTAVQDIGHAKSVVPLAHGADQGRSLSGHERGKSGAATPAGACPGANVSCPSVYVALKTANPLKGSSATEELICEDVLPETLAGSRVHVMKEKEASGGRLPSAVACPTYIAVCGCDGQWANLNPTW